MKTAGAAPRRCGRCSRAFAEVLHSGHVASGPCTYCPNTDGDSFGGWVNRRLSASGAPPLEKERLDADYASRAAAHLLPAINGRVVCTKCRLPFSEAFHPGYARLRGWRHCPGRDGDFAGAVLAALQERCRVATPDLPSRDSILRDRSAQEARWASRTARASSG